MKCKKHPYELGVGVCASCLRERLLALIAAQNDLPAEHHCLRPDPPSQPPPPPVFPRSVSPYVSHRRSDFSASYGRHYSHRFFSTPQVGPTFDAAAGDADDGRRRRSGRFSVFSILFRHHGSRQAESDQGSSKSSGSGSWFSALIRRHRKKKSCSMSAAEGAAAAATGRSRLSFRAFERGMSPAKEGDEADGCSSGYSTESSSGRRPAPTPMRWLPASAYHHHGGSAGVSGFAVCLSPLMRGSFNGRRGQPAEAGMVSGDLRSTARHRHHRRQGRQGPAGGASLGPNRSRKMAEPGRFD